jgi:hypothetical protein
MDKSKESDHSMSYSGIKESQLSEQQEENKIEFKIRDPIKPVFEHATDLISQNKSEVKPVKKLFPMRSNLSNSNINLKKSIKVAASNTVNEYLIGFSTVTERKSILLCLFLIY